MRVDNKVHALKKDNGAQPAAERNFGNKVHHIEGRQSQGTFQ